MMVPPLELKVALPVRDQPQPPGGTLGISVWDDLGMRYLASG
jgi:hypothetical protein